MSEASFASRAISSALRRSTTCARGVDLVGRAQALGERLQLIAAAGGEAEMAAFFGKGFGRGRADAL